MIDDLLDFTGTGDTRGKPGLQDRALGLSTAPVLYGLDEHPELKTLVGRKFEQEGDVQRACELVLDSQGLQRTKELAMFHGVNERVHKRKLLTLRTFYDRLLRESLDLR